MESELGVKLTALPDSADRLKIYDTFYLSAVHVHTNTVLIPHH